MSGAPKDKSPPKRILLVEDEPAVANTIRVIIMMDGHEVEHAEDGNQALAMFRRNKHDLVVTDFSMPGMDGLELASAIKALSLATPIIMITALYDLVKDKGQVSNVDELLGKPCSITELQAALRRHLGS